MTSTEDVDVIRYGLKEETDMRVCLLNYRKNGTAFLNQFNLSPLRDTSGKLVRQMKAFFCVLVVVVLVVIVAVTIVLVDMCTPSVLVDRHTSPNALVAVNCTSLPYS